MVPPAPTRGRRWLPAAASLLLLAGLLPAGTAPVLADSSVQAVPFAQNWSDIGLITADDTWTGVPGIIGYRGDGLTGVAGTDPRTVLADGSGTPVDVNANITNPNTFGTGGVIEYQITDPVVALQGSATARAPHIVINIDTTGLQNINVAYNLRDVDGSSDNTTMQVALHYRVGSTGSFTDVPAAYVADASSGPNLATLVTPVSVGLPAAVNDQPLVQVRILMTDAPSTDESVGIDDISITSSPVDDAPGVVATTPANGAVDVPIDTTPTVTFSEDVALSGVTLSCTGQGPKTVTSAGGPSTFSLGTTPFQNGDHCTLSIAASAVTDLDANDPPDTMAADFTASFDTAPVPPIALVINEVDYDQPGTDTAEYLELKNITGSPVDLDPYAVVFVNGANGGAVLYRTVDLPAVSIAADDYFVLCANTTTVSNCDLDGTPDTDWIQNGAPDALGLTFNGVLVDAVSYEGNTAAPYTETSGDGLVDTAANALEGLSRCPDGTDTNVNNVDFLLRSGTPGDRNACPGDDTAPSVATTFPADGATDVNVGASLSVTFSEPVTLTDPWFELTCNLLPKPATYSGGPTTFTIDPDTDFADGDACSLTVIAASVADQDATDPPDTMTVDFTIGFTTLDVCVQPFTPIYSIQGSGLTAAITGDVTTQGVVVGAFDTAGGVGGFYIQDPVGDGDPTTSDGIFVFTANNNTVGAGDVVRVSGVARERFNQTALTGADNNTTPVSAGNIVSCDTGTVAATDVTMPFADATFPERYEGMLVTFPQSLVISEYFNYDQFGEIVLAMPLDGEDRPFTGTAIDEPGAAANARTLANTLRRITLDDNRGGSNPAVLRHPNGDPFSLTNRFRGGDTVANATGVLGFDFSLYRIFPTAPADYTEVDPRPAAPEAVGGTLRAAAMNTLNFFITLDYPSGDPRDNTCGGNGNLECRGADFDQPLEFGRQRDKLLQALAGLDADVIGLNELENSPGVDALLDPTNGVVAGLNAMPGVGPYAAIDTGVIGTDAIRVGLIYRTDAVAPVGAFKVLDSSVDPRFIDTRSRPVLAQTFEDLGTGARFTVAVNHLKSKGSGCADIGDPDAGDGQGNCNLTRKAAAEALVDWLATDPTGSGDRDYLILGDLNSYAKEDPVDAIQAGADDVAGSADDYTNLIAKYQGMFAHSYVFDGQAGYLDYALASPTLVGQVTGAADWHINSDEPDVVDYDTTFKPPAQEALYEANPYRSSDHDPVVVGLQLLSYRFEGFKWPVDNPPELNKVHAGLPVPFTFRLARNFGLGVLFGAPTSTRFTCGSSVGSDVATAIAIPPGLIYVRLTNTYTWIWKTQKAWKDQCRRFEMTFDDGTYRTADFKFK